MSAVAKIQSLQRHQSWLVPLFLMVATFIVFSPVALVPFKAGQGFFWDDHVLLTDNALIKEPGLTGLRDIWFSTRNPDYFPLTSTTFWLEWRAWGENAWGYHFTNALLHAGSAVILCLIFRQLAVPFAALAALLFAIHPVNVESVSWIAERKNTLSMFLLCGSLLCFLHAGAGRIRHPRLAYAGSLALFFLSLLAKTAVVMFPFVLLLLTLWLKRSKVEGPRLSIRDLLRTAPFFLLSLVLGLITIAFQHGNAIGDTLVRDDSLSSRLATAGCAIGFYLGKAILPIGITFNYTRWNVLADFGVWAFVPLILLASLLAILFVYRRTPMRHVLVALVIYILMLFPMLGLHPALNIFFMRYSLVSDHWQYHAIPAICALLAGALFWLIHSARRSVVRNLVLAVAAAGVVTLAVESISIATVYRSEEALWLDTVAHNPSAWLAHAHLGEIYVANARSDPAHAAADLAIAIPHLQRVTELVPEKAVGHTNLANACQLAGRLDEAAEQYRQALAAPVISTEEKKLLHLNLGALLARAHDFSGAQMHFREALELDPQDGRAHYYLGMALADQGEVQAARDQVDRALELGFPDTGHYRERLATMAASATSRAR